MTRASASGYSLSRADVPIILGMHARGDRDHDIAAWFGVNQGRIKQAKDGDYGKADPAPSHELPPRGAPGIKGRRLRASIDKVIEHLQKGATDKALSMLHEACERYDANEA